MISCIECIGLWTCTRSFSNSSQFVKMTSSYLFSYHYGEEENWKSIISMCILIVSLVYEFVEIINFSSLEGIFAFELFDSNFPYLIFFVSRFSIVPCKTYKKQARIETKLGNSFGCNQFGVVVFFWRVFFVHTYMILRISILIKDNFAYIYMVSSIPI